MSSSLSDVLLKPDDFFRVIAAENESLKMPALIILAGAAVAAVHGYFMGGLSAKMMADVLPGMDMIIALSAMAVSFVAVFVLWLIAAGVFYALSYLFKGQGTFTRVLEVVGYGYLPQVAGSIISLLAGLMYIPKIVVPTLSKAALQDPAMIQEATKAFMHDPAMMELTQITALVTIVCMLLSAHIWIYGMTHARGLSARDAALCVGVPVVLYVLYMIWTLGAM